MDAPIASRETALALAVGLMTLIGAASALLGGRVSARVHVALAMLVVLAGAVALLVTLGGVLYASAAGGVALIVALIALFKLMNRFEARPRPTKPPPGER